MMTDEEFEELKRVCRIWGVPEPTEDAAVEFCESQRRETVEIVRGWAKMSGRNAGSADTVSLATFSRLLEYMHTHADDCPSVMVLGR